MFERLRLMLQRYEELTNLLADADVIADQNKWREYAKEPASMEEAIALYKEYLSVEKNMEECKEMMESGDELADLAKEEFEIQPSLLQTRGLRSSAFFFFFSVNRGLAGPGATPQVHSS